jgi:hypothetical protein
MRLGWILFLNFIDDDSGQGTVEYLLLLSASIVAAGGLMRALSSGLDHAVASLGGVLEQDLKTGRASVSIWQN